MINIDKHNFFIFDCDGVILDSNKLKSNAFTEALTDEPLDLVTEFVKYHKENGGISRYEKFSYYFEVMKKQVEAEVEIKKALNNFAAIVSKGLISCNYIPGALEFIEYLFKLNKRLFVVSGSDEKELIEVFRKRGIDHYFENIHGSPDNKIDNTKKVIKTNSRLTNGIFFGDSKADYEAASQYGMDFIFINGATEWFNGNRVIDREYVYNNFNRII
jgi:phosphoglycolate phosphatase-like HAD superfamily hydrolase